MSVVSNTPIRIVGESDVDFIYGSIHNDFFDLSRDDDDLKIVGFDGDDTIFSGLGDDILIGGAGNDFIFANAGSNSLRGGTGNDHLLSKIDAGTERGDYRDVMDGGVGDDVLASESSQNCTMNGGAGNDFFSFRDLGAAESGVSYCIGGDGEDSFNFFEFDSSENVDPSNTVVRIKDFEVGIDSLKFHFYGDEYQTNAETSFIVTQKGANMVVDFQDKVSIVLHGIDSQDVTMSDLFNSDDLDPIDPILF
ncbi:calcium-binding protein [Enterovibrio calviensis]|uniref:calcium-binding protein n=1 Tax=Enterovibrio calviensis TaxID=91359 RepID=UPI00047FF351|nr:calcium-binding protein [Enterovibrio calviensis]